MKIFSRHSGHFFWFCNLATLRRGIYVLKTYCIFENFASPFGFFIFIFLLRFDIFNRRAFSCWCPHFLNPRNQLLQQDKKGHILRLNTIVFVFPCHVFPSGYKFFFFRWFFHNCGKEEGDHHHCRKNGRKRSASVFFWPLLHYVQFRSFFRSFFLSFFLSFWLWNILKNLVLGCDRAFIVLNNCYDLSQLGQEKVIQTSFSSCKQVDIFQFMFIY